MITKALERRKKTEKRGKCEYNAKVRIQVSIKKKRKFGIGYEVMRNYK